MNTGTEDHKPQLVPLGEELWDDKMGVRRKQLLEELKAIKTRLQGRLETSEEAEERDELVALIEAVESAERIAEKVKIFTKDEISVAGSRISS